MIAVPSLADFSRDLSPDLSRRRQNAVLAAKRPPYICSGILRTTVRIGRLTLQPSQHGDGLGCSGRLARKERSHPGQDSDG